MNTREVEIQNETGLHARPASIFVREASKFKSEITIIKNEKKCNAKSIMSLLSMAVGKGNKITIQAVGEDEEIAVNKLVEVLNSFKD